MTCLTNRRRFWPLLAIAAAWAAGCDRDPYSAVRYSGDLVKFKDDAVSNVPVNSDLEDSLEGLVFTSPQGESVDLNQYRGKKNLVLVVTRGYGEGVCLYCATQTSRLIANYQEFARRDAEVLVVFPVEGQDAQKKLDAFLKASYDKLDEKPQPTPFPLLLDVDLAAVDRLGIREDLAKPATYILDKQGRLRFAYVGQSISDRPSLAALLQELDRLSTD